MSENKPETLIDWNVAAEKLCAAMDHRAAQLAKRASESLYEDFLYSVQDYLRDNTEFNLSSELAGKNAEIARLQADKAALLTGAKLALEMAEGNIKNDYEGTSAYHPMMAELEPVRAVLSKVRGAAK